MINQKIIIFTLFILVFCSACQVNKSEDETTKSIQESISTNETQTQEKSSLTEKESEWVGNENNNVLTLKIIDLGENPPADIKMSFFKSKEVEDIRIFNEIYDEAFKLEEVGYLECMITHTLHSGDKTIEVYDCQGWEKELGTDIYLSGKADLNNPTRRIPKDNPLHTKLWSIIEKLEQTENLYEQTEDIK